MTQIKLKRVYDEYDVNDGFRILIDRLWPRGVKKEHLHYDLWMKDITPSTELRQWFHDDPDKHWEQFKSAYESELAHSDSVKKFIGQIKQYKTVTLLYAAKNPEHNHAVILKKFIEKSLSST